MCELRVSRRKKKKCWMVIIGDSDFGDHVSIFIYMLMIFLCLISNMYLQAISIWLKVYKFTFFKFKDFVMCMTLDVIRICDWACKNPVKYFLSKFLTIKHYCAEESLCNVILINSINAKMKPHGNIYIFKTI